MLRVNSRSIEDWNNETSLFTPDALSFDYTKVHPKYYVSANPDAEIVLYKGAPKNMEQLGFNSLALNRNLSHLVDETKDKIESGDEDLIYTTIDNHTSYHSHTALLSTTYNPQLAQMFAPTRIYPHTKKDWTIYQLKIKAKRCIVDYHQTGYSGASGEILILGKIFPEEITAVKIINDDEHSELRSFCGKYIKTEVDKESTNRLRKDATNWISLRI
jgi:hypothetical protein